MTEDYFPIIAIIAIVAIVGIVGGIGFLNAPAITGASVSKVAVPVLKAAKQVTVTIPPHAVELAPGVFDLGTARVKGEVVQGFMFIDFRKGYHHKPGHGGGPGGGGPGGKGKGDKCFAVLAKGARWKNTESYVLNPANGDGLSESFVNSSITTGLETWDAEVPFDIFGSRTITNDTLVADTVAPDEKNEVYFGAIEGEGSIAVAIVWGIFTGPPGQRRLVEWDIVYDDAEFKFGDAGPTSETSLGDTSVMDLLNIATHESGHAVGLGHPDDSCTEETMYRFAGFGETKKRTLNSGDIAGVNDLYK